MLITFKGRKSGKQFTTPVAYVRDGDRLLVGVAEPETKRWWRNLREPAEVRLRIGSEELVGRARAVTDGESEHLASLLQRLVERHPKGGQVIGVSDPVAPSDVAGCVAVEILVE